MAPIPSAHGPTEFAPDACPVILRMASSPQAPASLPTPCPQFRKNLWPLHNYRPELDFWRCQQSFRNWTPKENKNAGTWNAPGLPNLTGGISNIASGGEASSVSNSNSALYVSTRGTNNKNPGSAYGHTFQAQLDASRYNTIYGNSDTVMPPSINQPAILYLGRSS